MGLLGQILKIILAF